MDRGFSRYVLAVLLLYGLASAPLAQSSASPSRDSAQAARILSTSDYAAALVVLEAATTGPAAEVLAHTPAMLWMREQKAYALDRLHREEEALRVAKAVIHDAQDMGDFRTVIEARLTVALIYEKYGLTEKCAAELQQIGRLLDHHPFPASRARYFVRMASYQRFYGSPDSLQRYARLAFEAGKRGNFVRAVADGAFLIVVANRNDEAVCSEVLQEAAAYIRQSGNMDLSLYMLHLLYRVKTRFGDLDEADRVMDKIEYQLVHHEGSRYVSDITLVQIMEGQAEVAARRGAYAQAYAHARDAATLERQLFDQQSEQKVQEIEARYDLLQKDAVLARRNQELAAETRQKEWLARILLTVSMFVIALGLLIFYLRRARRELAGKAHQLNTTNTELGAALEEQKLLRAELHHRVKNNLQVIISLLEIQEEEEHNPQTRSTLHNTSERVSSIAAVHELLYPVQGEKTLDFRDYVDKLCHHARSMWPADRPPAFTVTGEDIPLDLETLVPLGIILSELMMNTRKYIGPHQRKPTIAITLQSTGGATYRLRYQDNGPGFPGTRLQERIGGLGTYLLHSMSRQLRGELKTYNDQGAVTEVYFKLKADSFR